MEAKIAQVPSASTAPQAPPAAPEYVAPCLIGAVHEDRAAYELGAQYRPMAYGLLGAGIIDLLLLAVVLRRFPQLIRVGLLVSGLFLTAAGGAMLVYERQIPAFVTASTHEHGDIAVVVEGTPIDLSADRYQSEEGHVLSDFTHLHDGNGKVVHKHALGVTWGYFLHSIGLPIDGRCVTQPDGSRLCDAGTKRWSALVNGAPVPALRDLEIHDLDRVLLYYGNLDDDALRAQFDAFVSNDACVASGKCPERGEPPYESCGA